MARRPPCQHGYMSEESDRSLARIEIADLRRLAALAADAEAELFRRNPDGSGRYAGRLLGRALCQGAALHYVNGRNGVKDFDVWSFYAQYDDWPFPARWRGNAGLRPVEVWQVPSRRAALLRQTRRSSRALAPGRTRCRLDRSHPALSHRPKDSLGEGIGGQGSRADRPREPARRDRVVWR